MSNTKNFIGKKGFSTGDGYAMPTTRPSVMLDFANSKALDPRVTFARGSTGTYWDGVSRHKSSDNSVPYSDMSAGNTATNVTLTSNATTAPDGTNTALKVEYNGTASTSAYVNKTFPLLAVGEETVFSWFVKQGTVDNVHVGFVVQVVLGATATFTFSTETFSGVSSGITCSFENYGNGWYRLIFAYTTTGAGTSGNFIKAGLTTSYGAGDYFYAWGPQLEYNSGVTALTATGSTRVHNFKPTLKTATSGIARFNHTPSTSLSKGLLVEAPSTNLETQSQTLSTFSLSSGVSLLTNHVIAPDGTRTGVIFRESDGTTAYQRMSSNYTVSNGSKYTISVYAKAGFRDYLTIDTGPLLYYNLTTGVVSGATSSVNGYGMEYVGDGWYRCWCTELTTSTSLANYVGTWDGNGNGGNYTGIQYDAIYLWGVQVEQTERPSSYIATSGSQVTRSGDQAKYADPDAWFSAEGSTLYVEYETPTFGETNDVRVCQIQDEVNRNQYAIYVDSDSNGVGGLTRNYVLIENSGQMQTVGVTYNNGDIVKAVLAVAYNDGAFTASGAAVQTDTSMLSEAPTFAYLSIGSMTYGANAQYLGQSISKIAYWPERLSDDTLIQLTEA